MSGCHEIEKNKWRNYEITKYYFITDILKQTKCKQETNGSQIWPSTFRVGDTTYYKYIRRILKITILLPMRLLH